MARGRPRFGLRGRRRLRGDLTAGSLARRGPRSVRCDLHARDLASPAVQLRVPRQHRRGGPVLGGALRGRRGRRHQRPRPRLRTVRAPDPRRHDRSSTRHPRIRRRHRRSGPPAVRGRRCQQPVATGHQPRHHPVRPAQGLVRLDVHADHGLRDRFREGPRVTDRPGPRRRHRWRDHRLQRRLPPGSRRLDGRAPRREGPADGRFHLPGRRARHGLQPVVHDDGLPALQHRALSKPRRLRDRRQPAAGIEPGAAPASSSGRPAGRAGSGWMRASSAPTRLAA